MPFLKLPIKKFKFNPDVWCLYYLRRFTLFMKKMICLFSAERGDD